MYAARLADDDASMPVAWWYIPIFTSLQPAFNVQPKAIFYNVTAPKGFAIELPASKTWIAVLQDGRDLVDRVREGFEGSRFGCQPRNAHRLRRAYKASMATPATGWTWRAYSGTEVCTMLGLQQA